MEIHTVKKASRKIEIAVCALVTVAFTNIYLTQPILPVLQTEFGVTTVQVSLTVSCVILGIVLSNLVFGYLSDQFSIVPILTLGGVFIAAANLICATTNEFNMLLGARLVQGLFIPALTTSVAAWLAKNLPHEQLPVVMGTYVASTVLGGLGGRLLGGWIYPPLHWRFAFLTAAVLIIITTVSAVLTLAKQEVTAKGQHEFPDTGKTDHSLLGAGFISLVSQKDLLLLFLCGLTGFLMFSSIFNYLPYRLSGSPFNFSTEQITIFYLVYVIGIFLSPIAGRLSKRFGSGNTLILGCITLIVAFCLLLIPTVWAVIVALLFLCAGFFTLHATAVGSLNRKLSSSQGRANALYVLFYYIGGWIGITMAGLCFEMIGWNGMILGVGVFIVVPLFTGINEKRNDRNT